MSVVGRVVVVSRKPQVHNVAQEVAREVFVADDVAEAMEIVATVAPDATIFDETHTPHHVQAYVDRAARELHRSHRTVVLASHDGSFSDSEYRRVGVSHCLVGPEHHAQLHNLLAQWRQAGAEETARTDNDYFLDDVAAAAGMVGRSPATARTLHMIRLLADSQCNPVLITGDTGTGKEVAARTVHMLKHPEAPFVAINCAALTANLLESELFGHRKGAFTGADRDKTGLLELAATGTVFLDEISEIPLELQAKLLRVLQERTFRRVGGLKDVVCEATIITSSNRNLTREVREKRFRQDLYYRLNICPIALAPLRSPERRDDIELLANYFLETSRIRPQKRNRAMCITRLAIETLQKHHWPGNVRELRNVIERAVLLETKDKVGLDNILIESDDEDTPMPGLSAGRIKDFSLQKAERELIARALHETGWQKTQAASLLGITRATLYAKVKQYDIRKNKPGANEPVEDSADIPAAAVC